MKNEELIKRNIKILKEITADKFLKKEYFESNDNVHKEQVINLIKTQKSYLEKYKDDYENYFMIDGITENVVGIWYAWILIGIAVLSANIFSSFHFALPLSLKNIFIIIILGFITPCVLCWKIIPDIKGKSTYYNYLENLNTKLEIIKNDMLEKGLIKESQEEIKDKKINDSFVKMIKDTITEIKSLDYVDKEKDILKIKEISEEYFTILRKEIELDDVINLTTNEDIINLQKRLIEIENDAIAKSKIESDESALESEFEPLTTLDRRSVELDTGFRGNYNGDVPAILKRKLNLYDD